MIATLQNMGHLEEKIPGKKDLTNEELRDARAKLIQAEKSGAKI